MNFSEAAENWLASRTLNIKQGHARFVADGTLVSYAEYIRALNRFFSALPLDHIHLGHLRVYQEQRAGGELGAPRDVVLARCAKQQHTTVEGLRNGFSTVRQSWAAEARSNTFSPSASAAENMTPPVP